MWKSAHEHVRQNKIENDDAETIIRSCGQQTPHLWPDSFPAYASELYCKEQSVYSILDGEETLIADVPPLKSWIYHAEEAYAEGKILAAALESGAVAICNFVTA